MHRAALPNAARISKPRRYSICVSRDVSNSAYVACRASSLISTRSALLTACSHLNSASILTKYTHNSALIATMLTKQLLSVSALALTANALLVPTGMLEKVDSESKAFDDAFMEEILGNFNGVEVVKTNSKTVHLDCSTCPFALKSERHGKHEWISNTTSDLEMTFATEDGKLTLNGVPFYPISNTLPPILAVKQIERESEASEGHHDGYEGELIMSYGLEFENKRSTEENAEVVSIIMSIIGLEDQMIKVDDIEIKLVETKGKVCLYYAYFQIMTFISSGNHSLHQHHSRLEWSGRAMYHDLMSSLQQPKRLDALS